MYLKPAFEEKRTDVLHALIRQHPLATFIVAAAGEISVNHMPLVVHPEIGGRGTLRGHTPRDNPLSGALDGVVEAVAVFHGAERYITPSWYPSKRATGRVAPTWNYVVVHARGRPRVIDDARWLRTHLEHLTDAQEAGQALPWKVTDAPEDFTEAMIGRLVGIEMPIESLVGKWKVSQNRPRGDRLGVIAGLESIGDDASIAMAGLVRERLGDQDGRG